MHTHVLRIRHGIPYRLRVYLAILRGKVNELCATRVELRGSAFVFRNVGEFVTVHSTVRRRHLRECQCIGGRTGRDGVEPNIALEYFPGSAPQLFGVRVRTVGRCAARVRRLDLLQDRLGDCVARLVVLGLFTA